MTDNTLENFQREILSRKDDDLRGILYDWGEHIEGFEFVTTVEGENRRWQQGMQTVFEHAESGRFFAVEWDHGLTEMQEDDMPYTKSSIYEVEPVEVTVVEYRKKTND